MLSFFAEFPLRSGTPADVLRSVAVWLKGSPHRVLPNEDLDSLASGQKEKIESSNQSVEVIRIDSNDEAIGARHTSFDNGIIYSTTIVSRIIDEITWVSIGTDRASISPQISLKEARKPHIVKLLLRDLGGGLDGEIWVSDKAHLISESDENMAIRLLNGDSENHLPVIYLSRSFHGFLACDPDALARHLGGLAHVIVEPSRSFSRSIQIPTNSRNAYGGAVGIYLPTGQRSLILPDNQDEWQVRRAASEVVREALLTRLPMRGFSWAGIEAEKSRRNIEALKGAGSTDLDAFVREFDAENQALRDQTEALSSEISKLKAELHSLNAASSQGQLGGAKKFAVQDFFPGESDQFLREAIESAANNALEGSRRRDVLFEFLNSITPSDEIDKRRHALKQAISNSEDLDAKTEKILKDLGFSITSSGKHHKLVYFSDPRYTLTMAKTASDWRAGKNMAGEILRKIY